MSEPVFIRAMELAGFLDNVENALYTIIKHYKKYIDTQEPLDADEVECLVKALKAKINLIEGNLMT